MSSTTPSRSGAAAPRRFRDLVLCVLGAPMTISETRWNGYNAMFTWLRPLMFEHVGPGH